MTEPLPTDAMAKRAILYSDRATEDAWNAMADRYFDAERFGEALEFLERTRDRARLDRVLDAAVLRGDAFLLQRVESIGRRPAGQETWRSLAARALELGKHLDAYRALVRAGDSEKAEALREEHLPDFRPFRPEGK